MFEIISVICVVLIIVALCKCGVKLLLNIILHPAVLILIGVGLIIWGIIVKGIGATVLIVLGLIALYFLRRNKH